MLKFIRPYFSPHPVFTKIIYAFKNKTWKSYVNDQPIFSRKYILVRRIELVFVLILMNLLTRFLENTTSPAQSHSLCSAFFHPVFRVKFEVLYAA